MSRTQGGTGGSYPHDDSPLSQCLPNLSADHMASNLSRSFVVNMPTFNTAMNKDAVPRSPMASAINPFFPPITLSAPAHKRQLGGRTPPEPTEMTNLRRAPPTENDVMHAEI